MDPDADLYYVQYHELRDAVRRYLEDAYQAGVTGANQPWPLELEELTGWTEPDSL